MDTRRTIIAATLSAGVLLLWLAFVRWYEKTYPQAAQTTSQTQTPPAPSTAPTTNASVAASEPTTTQSAGLHAIAPAEGNEGPIVLGTSDPKAYAMQVFLTPHGAGLQKVILNAFKADVRTKAPYTFEEPYAGHPGTEPLATQSVSINGTNINLMGAPWKLVKSDAGSATYRVIVADGQTPIAEVTKTYTLSAPSKPDQGYELYVEQSVKSLGDRALNVKQTVNGPTQPPREIERGADLSVLAGFGQHQKIDLAQHAIDSGDFKPDKPALDLTQDSDKHHALWAGQVSTYFNALVLPKINDNYGQGFSVRAWALDPSQDDRHVAMTFETDPVDLKAAGQQASLPMYVYLGPKSRGVLKSNDFYESYPRMYSLTLVVRGSWICGFCTWDWLINVLFAILWLFHAIVKDWGLAIICLVLMVRVLLHPLTKSGQVHMMKMQKLAPEMEKLKKKHADDKEALNKAMMEYQKEVLPAQLLGCAPMFLQMPIWIALWSALQSTFELRQAPFLYGLTWIKDLAKPDGLITFSTPIPLYFFNWHLSSINLLPLLMGVATYVNQKYFMPKPTATLSPEQEQTQKMTQTMSLFFPLMFYTFPSGLNLYYLTSTTVGIIESKRIRNHIKEREEAEKAGKVIVETRATRGARQRGDSSAPEPKRTGLMQRMADFQQRILDMADQEKKNKGKGRKQ